MTKFLELKKKISPRASKGNDNQILNKSKIEYMQLHILRNKPPLIPKNLKHTSKNMYSVPQQSNDFQNMVIAFTRI
jgi:hypothetical protein